MPSDRVVIMTTGTQGEPSSVLARVAIGQHSPIQAERGDTVIMSAHPIPGNEEMVNRTINRLFQRGAKVLYDPIAQVHVSGHASQEEQKLMLNLVRPEYFIPVHGELRHFSAHEALARQVGVAPQNIFVSRTATSSSSTTARPHRRARARRLRLHGRLVGVGDVGPAVLRDREVLGRDGFVIAILHRDSETGQVQGRPEIITRGFVFEREAEDLLVGAEDAVVNTVKANHASGKTLRDKVKDALSEYLYRETKRRPMVIPVVLE